MPPGLSPAICPICKPAVASLASGEGTARSCWHKAQHFCREQSRLTPTLTWPALGASLGQAGQVNGIGLGPLCLCSPPQQQLEPEPGWAGILF